MGPNLRQIDYRLETGDWIKAYPGVYRMGVVPPTPEQQMRAAALWVDNGILSGVGAAFNLRLRLSSGRPVELDIAFEEERVAIEVDGFRYHSSSETHTADLRRQNEVIADGWRLLRYDPDVLVETPGRFIREVRTVSAADLSAHCR